MASINPVGNLTLKEWYRQGNGSFANEYADQLEGLRAVLSGIDERLQQSAPVKNKAGTETLRDNTSLTTKEQLQDFRNNLLKNTTVRRTVYDDDGNIKNDYDVNVLGGEIPGSHLGGVFGWLAGMSASQKPDVMEKAAPLVNGISQNITNGTMLKPNVPMMGLFGGR